MRRSVWNARLCGRSVTCPLTMAAANPTRNSYRLERRFSTEGTSGRASASPATSERNSLADRGLAASQASTSSGPYRRINGALDMTLQNLLAAIFFDGPCERPEGGKHHFNFRIAGFDLVAVR